MMVYLNSAHKQIQILKIMKLTLVLYFCILSETVNHQVYFFVSLILFSPSKPMGLCYYIHGPQFCWPRKKTPREQHINVLFYNGVLESSGALSEKTATWGGR